MFAFGRTANRYYQEAMKLGTGESLMSLVGGGKDGQENGVLQTLGSVDEREDGEQESCLL